MSLRAEYAEPPHGLRASGGQWLACVTKSAGWILMHSQATALPRRGFIKARGGMTAMCGEDDAARHGGAGSKERRELGVVSRSSRAPPRRRRTLFDAAQGNEHGAICVWGWRGVHLDRQNAERVQRLTLGHSGVCASAVRTSGPGVGPRRRRCSGTGNWGLGIGAPVPNPQFLIP